MKRLRLALGIGAAITLVGASSVFGQDLQEFCPNSEDGQGALWGVLSDPDQDMGLPGATVRATWTADGGGSAEAQTNFDGSYVLCYLPLETELAVMGVFATMTGQPMAVTLTEPLTERNLGLSMSGGGGGASDEGDDRIWACFAGGESETNLQYSRLIRCEANWKPLENCPKSELGSVSASPVGDGSDRMRDMLERLIADTRRLGANALINLRASRSSIRATAVKIEVDPATCT